MAHKRFQDYPKPSVAVDVVCLTVDEGQLSVLLYERTIAPQKGTYALPGGFVQIEESLEEAAARLLRDKAGLTKVFLEQLFTFGDPRRDPRGRVITVAYFALLDAARFGKATAKKLHLGVPWKGKTGGPVEVLDESNKKVDLMLDHADIIGLAVTRLRGKLDYTPVGFQLLPEEFTLRQLQDVHEAVSGEALNKDSFRRRVLAADQLEATGARERDVLHRPAELYRFVRRSAV
ncbi:MAG: NUDIX hydrolase [Myxococcaceae bacterium]|nr:NUDIX hydrolase [Myxococcaceae bacterium]